MEHFAYCIKLWDDKNVSRQDRQVPRCHGRVAMADAIIALTANIAMRGCKDSGYRPERIEFKNAWFDPTVAEVPDGHMKEEAV
jgi:hypothetical protein